MAFLLFGYPLVKTNSSASNTLNRMTHVSLTWILVNWWAHDSLHLHVGMNNLGKLLGIEYAFHFTIIVSAVIILAFLFINLRHRTASATPAG